MKNLQYKVPYGVRKKQVAFQCDSLNKNKCVFQKLYLVINTDDNEPYKYWVNMNSPFRTEKGVNKFLDRYLGNSKPSKYWR